MNDALPIAVLVSGSGTNLQAILDAAAKPGFGARVAVVISDRPKVAALDRARAAGVPVATVPWPGAALRSSFTEELCDSAESHGAELMVLAGFMRILAPVAMRRFPDAIVNVHPALLPAFPGAHAVEDALAHGVKVSGVTVHIVDEEVDHGPIVFQEAVPVLSDDTPATLHERIQKAEHEVYPMVIDAFARGDIVVDGRIVTWREG